MTLLEEMAEKSRQKQADGIKKDGAEGAFCRLTTFIDPNKMADWLHEESKRGKITAPALLDCVGQLIGMQLLVASGIGGKDPMMRLAAIEVVKDNAMEYLRMCFSGEHKMTLIVSDHERKLQVEATGEGMLSTVNLGDKP